MMMMGRVLGASGRVAFECAARTFQLTDRFFLLTRHVCALSFFLELCFAFCFLVLSANQAMVLCEIHDAHILLRWLLVGGINNVLASFFAFVWLFFFLFGLETDDL